MKIMKDAALLVIGAAIAVALMKANEAKSAVAAAPDFIPATQSAPVIQRFQPYGNNSLLALDTVTGNVCKTADWKPGKMAPGIRVIIESPKANLPLCSSL